MWIDWTVDLCNQLRCVPGDSTFFGFLLFQRVWHKTRPLVLIPGRVKSHFRWVTFCIGSTAPSTFRAEVCSSTTPGRGLPGPSWLRQAAARAVTTHATIA